MTRLSPILRIIWPGLGPPGAAGDAATVSMQNPSGYPTYRELVGAVQALLPARIVRRFARHHDVVDVALAQARSCEAPDPRLAMEIRDRLAAGIAHRGAQAADDLMHDVRHRPLVRHLALDALRHQLQRVRDLGLEVAVGRAARHGAQAAHAAIALVGAALIEE